MRKSVIIAMIETVRNAIQTAKSAKNVNLDMAWLKECATTVL